MKSFAVLAALAVSAAFVPFKAPAKDFVLNVSGTIKLQNQDTATKGTIATVSFNEKSLYALITNALASGTYIPATNMPANGYIAYSTNADTAFPETGYNGIFYVTNKSGFYYQLSGLDTSDAYNGSGSGVSTAVLYVHDDPYSYNDADNPDELLNNSNAIEIRGIATIPLKFAAGVNIISSFSLTGTGNSIFEGLSYASLVSSGHVKLSP
jgi:hypothetical protein